MTPGFAVRDGAFKRRRSRGAVVWFNAKSALSHDPWLDFIDVPLLNTGL
jgi:hypothetical protein